jgi:GxxExxY protein
MQENEISGQIIDAAIQVHRAPGPGLLESVYQKVLTYELELRGFRVQEQKPIAVIYKTLVIENAFFADQVVNEKVIVELKSVEEVSPVHKKTLLTYLRLTNLKVGLLINFNVPFLKDGITRIVNGFDDPHS